MALIREVAAVLSVLFSLGLVLSVKGKDPYLDFTCVASQALVPTRNNRGGVTITTYTPVTGANISVDGMGRNSTSPSRVGSFNCSLETEDFEAMTTVIISTADAYFYPSRLTMTFDPLIDEDEEITLRMTARTNCNDSNYRWFEVGDTEKLSMVPDLTLLSNNFRNRSTILLRNFCKGKNTKEYVGYVQVLLRECPSGKWSPEEDCQQDCSICLNGGMCHPQTGQCICPPGFSGSECQNVHGRNVFGQLGQYRCSSSSDAHDEGCRGQLFCLPEPFGCTCAAGYKGIGCTEECEEGTYGANCEQLCRCRDNSTCLADTGECDGSSCLEGWYGPNCQKTGLMVTVKYEIVNINQPTNVTCSVKYLSPFNESDFVLALPGGMEQEADYFIEYEPPILMEYIFVVVADLLTAEYTCAGINVDANATINVKAFEPPRLLNPPTVSDTTSNSITLTWEAWDSQTGDRGEGPLINYTISYVELNTNGSTEYITTPGDTLSYVVDGLKDGFSYEFRVSAVRPGVGGTGPPSPPTVANTTCAVPGIPINVDVEAINSTAVRLSWSPPAGTTCPTLSYDIIYWLKKQEECKPIKKPNFEIQNLNTRDQFVIVDGLLPHSLYKLYVKSKTEAGSSEKTPTESTTTSQSVPGPPVLQPSEFTSTTLTFTWTAPDCTDRNGLILGYHYQLLDRHGNIRSEGVTSSDEEETTVLFENLDPCTEYQFQVRGWTSAGNGSFSFPQNVTTAEEVPERISSLTVSAINSTQLRVTWSPPPDIPCQILGYTVSYTLTQQGQCAPAETAETYTISVEEVFTVNVSGLLPDSEYRVAVGAETAAGMGETLNATQRTLEGVPGPPTNVVKNDSASDSLSFSWMPPVCAERNGLITGYQAMLWNAELGVKNLTVSETHVQFENLLACTNYSFQVGAETSVGLGTITDQLTVQTEPELPGEVTDIQIDHGSTSLTITWQPPTEIPCEITGYNLTYTLIKYLACDVDEDIDYENIDEVLVTTTNPNYSAEGLSPYSTYLVSVAALTSAGIGNWTHEYANTSQDVAGPPTAVMNDDMTSESLSFTWDPPVCAERSGLITGYRARLFNDESRVDRNLTVSETHVRFENLLACTDYSFQVCAETSVGLGEASDQLTVETEPELPSEVTDIQIDHGSTSLTITWQPPTETPCEITGYNLTYTLIKYLACDVDEDIDYENIDEVSMTTTDPTYSAEGLSPYSTYLVSVAALTSAGMGNWTHEYANTSQDKPSPPMSVSETLATSSALGFSWRQPNCTNRNGIIESYNYLLGSTSFSVPSMARTNDTMITFEGLKACTRYQFKVQAKTSKGYGEFSSLLETSTEGQAPNAVQHLGAQRLETSLELTWMKPANITCLISRYLVSYKLIKHLQCPENDTDAVMINETTHSVNLKHTISELSPASKYLVSVRAKTIGGISEERSLEVETLEAAPGRPTNVSSYEITSRSLGFTWEPPPCDKKNGVILKYKYKFVEKEPGTLIEEEVLSPNITSLIFEHLDPCTLYRFKVLAETSGGLGIYSTPIRISTEEEVPQAVNDVSLIPSSRSLAVTWTPPNAKPCGISGFRLTYKLLRQLQCADEIVDSRELNLTLNNSITEQTIEELLPDSVYSVTVAALNDYGLGAPVGRTRTTLKSSPGPVSNVSIVSVGQYSADFNWYPPSCEDSHGNITGYQWTVVALNGSLGETTLTGNTTETSVSVTNLIPCSTYIFSVRAETSVGFGQESTSASSTTSAAVPGKVNTPEIAYKNSTFANITWPSPMTSENPCPIHQYTVTYYLKKLLACPPKNIEERFVVNTSYTWLNVMDLRPFSVYKVSVVPSTMAGYGEGSDELRLETNPAIPRQVTDVIVTNATRDSIRFAWSALDCEERHDKITGYRYEFRSAEHSDNDDEDGDGLVTDTTRGLFRVFDDLDSCTEYKFRVRAVGKADSNLGVWSEWVEAVTSTVLPEPVENLTLHHGDNPATQILVSWQPSPLDDCPVSSYQVGYKAESLEECSLYSSYNWTYTKVDNFSTVLSSLEAYSRYTVTVSGKTAAGPGEQETAVLQTSEDGPTGPPESISTNGIGPREINFTWQPPTCGQQNGAIFGYNYTLLEVQTNTAEETGSVPTENVLIRGLVPYVRYQFLVQANTRIGTGPVGNLIVRTQEGEPPPPRNFRVLLATRSTLELEWNPPEPPSGVISAYQIKHWESSLDESSAVPSEPLLNLSNPIHRYTISGLKPFTDYSIKIRANTGAGYGEWTDSITHKTAQGAPEAPANVNVGERTETSIAINWKEPVNLNGVLTEYKIGYRIVDRPFDSSSGNKPVSEQYRDVTISKSVSQHRIDNLDAATGYEIRLAAKTVEFGEYFTLERVYTMIPAINEPTMPAPPSLGEDNTVTLRLQPILSGYISVYQVTVSETPTVNKRDANRPGSYEQSPDNYVTAEFNKTDLPPTFKVGDDKTYGGYHNAPLQPDTQYAIQFCGVGKTQQDTQSSCSAKSSVTTNPINTGPGIEAILAAVIAVMVLVVIVLVVMVIVRKRRQTAKSGKRTNGMVLSDMEKADTRANGLQNQAMVEEMVRSQLRRSGGIKGQSTTPVPHPQKDRTPPKKAWKLHKPVTLQDLPQYVKRKKANGNKGFTRDYASFPDDQLYSSDVAGKECNKSKNRYANITPYDYSRVVLDPINDDPETDYVNASYIDGYQQKNAYIATQGPNKTSTPDFWRMVWQQEVAIIVMLTNTVENNKKKCIQYWPDDQLDYKGIVVKKVSERVEQDFTERVFVIANISIVEDIPREVKLFHYTSWPDMGLPDSPAPLMNFIHEIKQIEENGMGPMVVHCSAGVGRTGTFITVDAMLNMVAEEKQINVVDFVYEMRKKRPRMVQTQDQYMFIFEVLLETLLCGDTVMNLSTFPDQYAALGDCNPLTGNSYVEEHFRVLDTMSVAPGDDNCYGGRNEMNQDKNRFQDCIPLDKSRPYLMSPGDEGSTNYINASFIDAYKWKDGFLATQSPLPNTVGDFWRMVYDYNARVIVMLNQIDGSDETVAPYWLDDPEETALLGIFEVQLRDCKDFKHTIARTFKVKNTSKATEKPRIIHHFEFLEWGPAEKVPPEIIPFLGFMGLVEQSHQQTGGDGRIAVHCLDGVSRSGIFCTVMASLEKLKEEKVVDVFHAVRNLRRNRHTMIDSSEQYLFCYNVLSAYLEENQTYANFR